jgi:hypothetical protein
MTQKNSLSFVPERFLRQLWKHQRFTASALQTTDGKPVEVISPGISNPDGGPDFINARIRIDGILYRGDVELHRDYNDWIKHSHHDDPKYNAVILHVVLHANLPVSFSLTKKKRSIPVLALAPYIQQPIHSVWNSMILDERSERLSTIKCFSKNDTIDSALTRSWLSKLAVERIELKVRRFEERLHELIDENRLSVKEPPSRYDEIPFGINPEDLPPPTQHYSQIDFSRLDLWRQLLYEGIMEALGYSKNQQQFLELARNLRLKLIEELLPNISTDEHFMQLEGLVFGVAGLLPTIKLLKDTTSLKHARQLRRSWRTFKKYFRGEVLYEGKWQFFRLRPENFPTVRLAGAVQLIPVILEKNFFKSIIQLTKRNDLQSKQKHAGLESLFIVPTHEFWSTHYRFGEHAKVLLTKLIGKNRADDIILNAVLPICLLYARVFKDREVRQEILKIFEQCPATSDNSVTRSIDKQLIKEKLKLDSAKLQQGAIQLYKSYCIIEKCGECAVGKIVFKTS